MAKHLIELQDGILVEIEPDEGQLQRVAGGAPRQVDKTIAAVKPLLLKACQPIAEAWQELNQSLSVAEAEVEIALGFEAKGNIFIAQSTANASLTIRLTLKAKT